MELGIPTLVLVVGFHLAVWFEARAIPEWAWAGAGYRRTIWLPRIC